MAVIKKLYFATGTDTTAPTDLSFEASANHLEVYANDAAYVTANGTATSGDVYLNSTLNAPRAYLNSAWRTAVMTNAGSDATKAIAIDTSGSTAAKTSTLAFASTLDRTFTFPDIAGTIVVASGFQTIDGKTFTAATLTSPTINTPAIAGGTVTFGTASNTNRLILPVNTLANLNTLTYVEGAIAYATDTDALYTSDGVAWNALTGSGGSSVVTVTQAAHGFTTSNLGAPLYITTGGVYTLAKADAANTSEVVGLVSSINNVNSFVMLIGDGVLTVATAVNGGAALVVGSTYYVSAATAGQITATEPSTIGNVSKPIGTAITTSTMQYTPGLRGVVVGGTNALTTIAVANNATTTIQNVAAYQGGELSGYVSISATTSMKFYIAAQFSKNAAGTDYNLSYQTSGETPPASFVMSVTSAGLIQITIGTLAGFTAASITFGLSVPSVGATFPLSISARSVIGDVSGTAVPAGYVGEIKTWAVTPTNQALTTTVTDWTNASVSLTPGCWLACIGVQMEHSPQTVAGGNNSYAYLTTAANTVIATTMPMSLSAGVNQSNFGGGGQPGFVGSMVIPLSVTTTTTYKIRVNLLTTNNGAAGTVIASNGASYFYAIRIA